MEASIGNLFEGLGIPEVDLGDVLGDTPVGPVVDRVLACLESGSLTSRACRRVLGNPALLRQLRAACERPRYRRTAVCRLLGGPRRRLA